MAQQAGAHQAVAGMSPTIINRFGPGYINSNGYTAIPIPFEKGFLIPQTGMTIKSTAQGSLSSTGDVLQKFGNSTLLDPKTGNMLQHWRNGIIDNYGKTIQPFRQSLTTNMGSSLGSKI